MVHHLLRPSLHAVRDGFKTTISMSEVNQATFSFQDQQLGGITVTVVDAHWYNIPALGGTVFGGGYEYVQNGIEYQGPCNGNANGQEVTGTMGPATGMGSYGNGQSFSGGCNP